MPHHLARTVGELILLLLGVWVIVFGVLEARSALRRGHVHSGRGAARRLTRRSHPRLFWSTTLFNGVVLPLLGAAILLALAVIHFEPRPVDDSPGDPRCLGATCWRLPKT